MHGSAPKQCDDDGGAGERGRGEGGKKGAKQGEEPCGPIHAYFVKICLSWVFL